MRRLMTTAIVLALGAVSLGLAPRQDTAPAPAPVTYEVDPVHSTALFRVHHLGAGQFWGRFNDVTGTIGYADGTGDLSLDVAIKVESVDTNSPGLNKHLKSPDFFNAKEFPTMTFKSTSVREIEGGVYDVTGDLTIRGHTKPITAQLAWTGTADMGMGKRCGFEARFTIDRGDYEVLYGLDNGMVGREVMVIVGLEGKVAG